MRINDNGIYRDMTPEEVKEMEEAMAQMPTPSSEPTVAELAQLLEQERKRGDQLQQDNEELYLYLAEKEYGAN